MAPDAEGKAAAVVGEAAEGEARVEAVAVQVTRIAEEGMLTTAERPDERRR